MQKSLRNLVISCWLIGTLIIPSLVIAQQSLTNINGWNAYVHLPAGYATSTQTYPTIIFFPGLGEVGTNPNAVIAHGPGAYITQGWNGNVMIDGNTVEFIVISLQPSAAFPNEINMNQKIQTIKSLYRVNTNKLYLTGLSHGGWCASTFVTGDAYGGPYNYASQIAAIVTVQGMKPDDNQPYPNLFDNFALSGGKLVGFEQVLDGRDTRTVVDRMNATVPNSAIYVPTNFGGGGHCCWNQFYGGQGVAPGNFMLNGLSQNIYEWLARQSLGTINQLPAANAGGDQSITLPVNFTALTGSATDPDGTVITHLWSQISGPSVADIYNVTAPTSAVSNLVEGVYQFSLKVTDNSGGSSTDTVAITVNPPVVSPCNMNAPVTYILTQTQPGEIYIPDASTRPWKGGDTLKIPAGIYTVIELSNFKGDPCKKIIITNMNGVVETPTMRVKNNSAYFRITGTGTTGIQYGFKINGGGLAISLSHDFEVDHLESTGGNLGMYIKTTPEEVQPLTLYTPGSTSNFLMKNIYIHHNYIHDISGEGMYIGHTGPSGGQNGNGSNGLPLMPLRLDNVEISYNTVVNTDWDGIQLSNARNSCKIHHNTVYNYGRINMGAQQSGIILGGNSNGDVYNNSVIKGSGNGIELFGYGTIRVYNNFVDSTGDNGTALGQESVFANDIITAPEVNPKQQILYYNNTVNHPKPKGAIRVGAYYSYSLPANLSDNQYCIPGAPANWQSTYVVANPTGSILTNNTLNCSGVNQPPVVNAGNNITITLPVNSTPLNGTASDPDGSIATYQWTKISGPVAGTLTNATTANATANGLVQGVYLFELRVTDNIGATARDTTQVTVIPVANQAPVANAGSNTIITLPVNTTPLNGTGSDPDGTIASYQWTKIAGPTAGTIASATSANATANGLVQGMYSFELRVTDNLGAVARDTVIVTVNPAANQAPSANAGTDISITLPLNTATLTGSGFDPDGTITTYLWTKIFGPATGNIANPVGASTGINSLIEGTYRFELRVTDNSGASARDTIEVVVNAAIPPPNQLPVANAGFDQAVNLPLATTLSGSGNDPDGTITGFQWTKISGPAAYMLSNPAAAVSGLGGLAVGIYQFELTVTDNSGASARDTMQLTVSIAVPPPNQLPTANAGADQIVTLPLATTLSGSGNDPDGSISGYLWTKISGPSTYMLSNPAAAVSGLGGLSQGTYQFELRVTDNFGATARDTMQIIVNPAPNQLPSANAGTDISITLPVNTAALSGSGTDPDGTINGYQWTKISGPVTGTVSNASNANATATDLVLGTYQFELTVTDNNGATGRDTMEVTVNPAPNQPPTANAGADATITLPINSTVLIGIGNDPDGTVTGFLWTKIAGPAMGTINSPATANTTLSSLIQGVYRFELRVTDNNGATGSDTVQVTVNAAAPPPNQAPSANAGANQTITLPASSTTLSGSGNDPDGTITSYLWTKISGPSVMISNANSAITGVGGLTQGIYQFELRVTDNSGAFGRDTMQITVSLPPNQTPTANAGPDQNITLPLNTITLNGTGSDNDGSISSYLWVKIAGPAAGTITTNTSATTTVTGLVLGVYRFELTVTDNSGATDKDTMQLTVNPAPNQAPTANAGLDRNLTLPTNSTTLNGTGNDPDGSITGWLWTKISGPAAGAITSNTSATTAITGLVQGVYRFELTVTDNSGAMDKDTMQLTVNPAPNQAPTANAGLDRNLTLPNNSTTLNGTGNDPDGNITGWLWTKLSGPAAGTMSNQLSAVNTLSSLEQGVYRFELRVTDNQGATGRDTIQVTVNAVVVPNQRPVANAGSDIQIYLPVNSTTLSGSGTDADGTIISYQWNIISGPTQYQINDPAQPVTFAGQLAQGIYEAELIVTDNDGATDRDTVKINVGNTRMQSGDYINVYPNPVHDILTIEINTSKVDRKALLMILDIRGSVIIQKEVNVSLNLQLETVDMSKYPKGEYFLRVKYESEKSLIKKIIKL